MHGRGRKWSGEKKSELRRHSYRTIAANYCILYDVPKVISAYQNFNLEQVV
jgi:hypothetical protein